MNGLGNTPVLPPKNLWSQDGGKNSDRNLGGTNKKDKSTLPGFKVDKFDFTDFKVNKNPLLSAAANSILEELKKKYAGVNFMVADFSTDEEAQRYLRKGKSGVNCVITPDLLERMAADEETREHYEGLIDSAIVGLDTMKANVSDKVSKIIDSYGIAIDSSGSVSYYITLKDFLPNSINDGSKIVKAGSIEELMKRLDEIDEERRAEKSREKQKEKYNFDSYKKVEEEDIDIKA
ncbi:MAG: DUF6033 family protein [Oscillospiraceae bacterium]|nr:DUF6033 family protein [Oscillospiraceae bacterium]